MMSQQLTFFYKYKLKLLYNNNLYCVITDSLKTNFYCAVIIIIIVNERNISTRIYVYFVYNIKLVLNLRRMTLNW